MKSKRDIVLLIGLLFIVISLLFLNVGFVGTEIPFSDTISILSGEKNVGNSSWSFIIEHRLIRSVVAIAGGGALSISGLILQVFFRNPLAGPGVLGITSGASLGVAAVIMGGFAQNAGDYVNITVLAGITGACLALFLLLFISKFVKNQLTLLVVGLMLGYFVSALVNIMFLSADQSETREYVIWGLGSFADVNRLELIAFVSIMTIGFVFSMFLSKGLNALVLGTEYAKSVGINIKFLKVGIIIVTSVLAAGVTVYCGPISFIGIAVPQLVRLISKSSNHIWIIPICFLGGGFLGIMSDIIVRLSDNSLPLNTVTALIGAPIIVWTIIKMNRQFAGV
ncbi:MAG: iron complex transport system permease protein [Arenicella sp.]|jgi:iron complex transport system permease protein